MNFLLDVLFPKRCVGCRRFGDYLCAKCFAAISFVESFVCPTCNRPSIDGSTHPICRTKYGLDGVSSGVLYRGVVKRLLYQFKYKPHLSDLKHIMGELLYEGLNQNEAFYHVVQYNPVVTYVPLHRKRLRMRGYNQARLLAEIIAKRFDLPLINDVLVRVRQTQAQYKLKKEERITNIKGAFAIDPRFKKYIQGKKILVVDDLATSFTTLSECARVLKKPGAKLVWGVTFAREM